MPNTYLDLVSFVPWTLIFTWLNLFILYSLIKKFLFKPVNNMLEQRKNEINTMYETAQQAQTNAEEMEKEYSERMAQAREEAGEIIKQATLSAQRREQEIISDAQEKAAIMTKRAEAEIAQERKKAYQEIKNEISDISVAIAGKMVQREISAADHEALISQFIENVGEV
ncbi:MAG: F0F1 ATP synthase subunit B [Oscillospiraceae bacterium]|nr:F0F1 ATP synthase subunit B [Oscillospiraceae bacterium]